MADAPTGKILLVYNLMGLSVYKSRTFFYHQSRFLFPVVLKYWVNYQAGLFAKIKERSLKMQSGQVMVSLTRWVIRPNMGFIHSFAHPL